MSLVGTRAIDQPNTKPSEKVNPRGTHGHTLKVDISSLDSEDSTIIDASKYKGNHRGLKNCDAFVSEVVQGIGRNGVFLTLPNAHHLTEFGTEPRRLLVEITRHREGLAIIIPDGALAWENYNLNSEFEMFRSHVRNIKLLVEMTKTQGVYVELQAPDTSECFQYDQKGHTKSTCTVSDKEHLPPQCWNCLERGHDARECKDPKDEALRPQVKKDADGEVFGCQTTDPNATNYFDVTDKAYIMFHMKKLNATGTEMLP
jgi:hypothetical protein